MLANKYILRRPDEKYGYVYFECVNNIGGWYAYICSIMSYKECRKLIKAYKGKIDNIEIINVGG